MIPDLARALVDLALPVVCASCGVPGSAVCPTCLQDAWGWCWPGGPRLVSPDPRPAGLPPVVCPAVNDGAVRRLLHAYKDEDRRDVRPVLRDLLLPALRLTVARLRAGRGGGRPDEVVVVPVPTSAAARRRRGDRPLEDLVAATTGLVPGTRAVSLLSTRGVVADQATLGAAARMRNLAGRMQVRAGAPAMTGSVPVLLVDDLLTTGATLVEAARALRVAGVEPTACVVVAATRRRPLGAAPEHGRR